MKWLDGLSLWAFGIVIVFIVAAIVNAVWLFFEFYRALVGDEDNPERHSHKSE